MRHTKPNNDFNNKKPKSLDSMNVIIHHYYYKASGNECSKVHHKYKQNRISIKRNNFYPIHRTLPGYHKESLPYILSPHFIVNTNENKPLFLIIMHSTMIRKMAMIFGYDTDLRIPICSKSG